MEEVDDDKQTLLHLAATNDMTRPLVPSLVKNGFDENKKVRTNLPNNNNHGKCKNILERIWR